MTCHFNALQNVPQNAYKIIALLISALGLYFSKFSRSTLQVHFDIEYKNLNLRPPQLRSSIWSFFHSTESSTWLTTIIIYLGSRFVPHSKSFSICPLPKRIQKPERRVGKALTATEMIQTAKIWNFFEVSFFEYGWTAPVYRFNWLPKMQRMFLLIFMVFKKVIEYFDTKIFCTKPKF